MKKSAASFLLLFVLAGISCLALGLSSRFSYSSFPDTSTFVLGKESLEDSGGNSPSSSESVSVEEKTISSGEKGELSPGSVNLNAADAEELQKLPGIGEKLSLRIVEYREKNGPFFSVDELTEVSGIGEKTLEKIRKYLTVS